MGGGELNADRDKTSSGQSSRSPEEIRKMLSRYRSGLNQGRKVPIQNRATRNVPRPDAWERDPEDPTQ